MRFSVVSRCLSHGFPTIFRWSPDNHCNSFQTGMHTQMGYTRKFFPMYSSSCRRHYRVRNWTPGHTPLRGRTWPWCMGCRRRSRWCSSPDRAPWPSTGRRRCRRPDRRSSPPAGAGSCSPWPGRTGRRCTRSRRHTPRGRRWCRRRTRSPSRCFCCSAAPRSGAAGGDSGGSFGGCRCDFRR